MLEEKTEKLEQNIEENNGVKAEEMTPAAGSVVDDDIEYTFVVPKGEVYREPEPEDETPEPETPPVTWITWLGVLSLVATVGVVGYGARNA